MIILNFHLEPQFKYELFHIYCTLKLTMIEQMAIAIALPGFEVLGDRAFCVAAPKLWNSLPQSLRKLTSVDSFKAQ